MMSQMLFTAPLTDCCEASRLPLLLADPFFFADFFFAIGVCSELSLECCAEKCRGQVADSIELLFEAACCAYCLGFLRI